MSKPSSLVDELGKAALDARAAVREVHEAIRDARQVIKELSEATAKAKTAAQDAMDEDVSALIKEMLEHMNVKVKEHMDLSVEKVSQEFQKLENLFLGRERDDDRPPLEEIIRRNQALERRNQTLDDITRRKL